MSWELRYKKDAYKFLEKNKLTNKFDRNLLGFLKGERKADIKKLSGKLKGHYRLRIGK